MSESNPSEIAGENWSLWATTTDGGLIRDLFGFDPTLSNASIEAIDSRPDGLTLSVFYADRPTGGDQPLRVRLSIEFAGSVRGHLALESGDVASFTYGRAKGRIQANFVFVDGSVGKIEADHLDIRLQKVDISAEKEPRQIRFC